LVAIVKESAFGNIGEFDVIQDVLALGGNIVGLVESLAFRGVRRCFVRRLRPP